MPFRHYLEDEDDKPYYTLNSLAFYYEDMERKQKLIESLAKEIAGYDIRLTDNLEAIEKEVDRRLADWDKQLERFPDSVEDLLSKWTTDGTIDTVIQTALIDEKITPLTVKLADTDETLSATQNVLKGNFLETESKTKALENKNAFHFPEFERSLNNPLSFVSFPPANPQTGRGYSLEFVTVFPAYRHLIDPIDDYYFYVGSHDGEGIWLFTSPTPEGELTLYSETPVVDLSSVVWGQAHISSPDVTFDEKTGKIMLFTHSPMIGNATKQPTGLHTSLDGVSFEPYLNVPIITNNKHLDRWNGTSLSYARMVKVGSEYYSVYQANGRLPIRQLNEEKTFSIGVAHSVNGYDWTVSDEPLKINDALDRGCLAPSVTHWNDYFLVVYGKLDGNLYGLITKDLTSETVYDIGMVFEKGVSGSYTEDNLRSPFFFFDKGVLYMYYGFSTGGQGGFSVAKAGVNLS